MFSSFRQSMTWLHSWAGLVVGWLAFIIFITGTTGYFDTEIDQWMQPERSPVVKPIDPYLTLDRAEAILRDKALPSTQWEVTLPVSRNSLDLKLRWRTLGDSNGKGAERISEVRDPNSGEQRSYRDTGGGQKLYKMHYRLSYMPSLVAAIIVGLCTMIMAVALTTGVIAHRKIFVEMFTFRSHKKKRSWLDMHNLMGVLGLPFHLMITYSGLLFFFMTLMPLIFFSVYQSDMSKAAKETRLFDAPLERSGEYAQLKPLRYFLEQVQLKQGSEGVVEVLTVEQPEDKVAEVKLLVLNKQLNHYDTWRFQGSSGELISINDQPVMMEVFTSLQGLHEGLFAEGFLRWLYFISGIFGTLMIVTGLVYWVQKRRSQHSKNKAGVPINLQIIEKVNIAIIVGFPASIGAFFLANRLLDLDMLGRAQWEVHIMFITWLCLCVHALIRPRVKAWLEQLMLSSLVYSLLPVVNALTTDRGFHMSLGYGDWLFVGFDLAFLTVGVGFALVASKYYKLYRNHKLYNRSKPKTECSVNI